MGKTKRRLTEIDFLYAVGVFLVIFGHSHSSDWSRASETAYGFLHDFVYSFHMQLFFSISGFLLMHSDKIKRIGYFRFLAEKALRLFVPYLFISLLAVFPKTRLETGKWIDVNVLMNTLFSPRLGVWGHLWFVPVLFFMFIFFGIIRMLLNEKNRFWILSATTILSAAAYFIPCDSQFLGAEDIKKQCLFFSLGMLLYLIITPAKQAKKPVMFFLPLALAACGIAAYLLRRQQPQLLFAVTAVCMVLALWAVAVCVPFSRLCRWLSVHNFTLYLYSWPAQSVVMIACDRFNFSWVLTFIVMFVTGWLVPLAMIFIYEKIPKIHCRVMDLLLGVK